MILFRKLIFLCFTLFVSLQDLQGYVYGKSFCEFRPTAFIPFSHRFKKEFGKSLLEYQFEAGWQTYTDWNVWGNVGYMQKRGKREETNRMKFTLSTFSVGANYHFPLNTCGWEGYVGAGPLYGRSFKYDSGQPGGHRHEYRRSLGGVLKMGLIYPFFPLGHLNFFCDYQQLVVSSHKLNSTTNANFTLSGLNTGVGIAIEF